MKGAEKIDWLAWAQRLQGSAETAGVATLINVGYGTGASAAEMRLIELIQQALEILAPHNMVQPAKQQALLDKLAEAQHIRRLNSKVYKALRTAIAGIRKIIWPDTEFADSMVLAIKNCADVVNNIQAATAICQSRKKLEESFIEAIMFAAEEAMDTMLEGAEPLTALIAVEVAHFRTLDPGRIHASLLATRSEAKAILTKAMQGALQQVFGMLIQTAVSNRHVA